MGIMHPSPDRDWPGGDYLHSKCLRCGLNFSGPKRQIVCRACDFDRAVPTPAAEKAGLDAKGLLPRLRAAFDGQDVVAKNLALRAAHDALSQADAQYRRGAEDMRETEKQATAAAMRQWEASLKRPDLDERARVGGALMTYARFMFADAMVRALPIPDHQPTPDEGERS